jgi:hypothetical protein
MGDEMQPVCEKLHRRLSPGLAWGGHCSDVVTP